MRLLLLIVLLVTASCDGPAHHEQQDWWRRRCENEVTLVSRDAKHEGRCAPRETMEVRAQDDGTLVICTCPTGLGGTK